MHRTQSIYLFIGIICLFVSIALNQQKAGLTLASSFEQTIPGQGGTIPNTPQQTPNPQLRLVADGFAQPLAVVSTGVVGDERLFVVEKSGTIRIIDADETVLDTPFLNISNLIENGNERGLLGLAFDPGYATNGYFYVNYSYGSGEGVGEGISVGDTVIARFQVTSDPNVADPNSFVSIMEVAQDFSNHNGGHILFGPDGYLYIGLGDGGSGGDPNDRAQDRNSLLGSMLRIDVIEGNGLPPECDPDGRYSVPETNPYLFDDASCDEAWAYGLRNPWRYSFDRDTGDLYIGDVGQNLYEEVSFLEADHVGGANFGWKCYEGVSEFSDDCPTLTDYVPPFFDYGHGSDGGLSVTGGNVYRGSAFTNMEGYYFFGDFVSTRMWRARFDSAWDVVDIGTFNISIASYGEDIYGELYIADFGGGIYQLVDDYGFDAALRGPSVAEAGESVSYFLTVTNVGSQAATDLELFYTIPSNMSYVSGGTFRGSEVTFSVPSLAPGESTEVSVTLTATQIGPITHSSYGVRSSVAPQVTGPIVVNTDVLEEVELLYTPFVFSQ